MLIAVQAMCARLGDVKRKGLMLIIREHYPPVVAYSVAGVLIVANTTTLGADLAGVAEAVGMMTGTSYIWWVVPIALCIWAIVVLKSFRIIERYLLVLSLVFICYVVSGLLARPVWHDVIRAIVFPNIEFSIEYLLAGVGLLGTTITPFLFFWQSRQGTEEKQSKKNLLSSARQEDRRMAPGFIYSNCISFFIMIASAQALFGKISPSAIMSSADAARALEPLAGKSATVLFSLGIIGAGLLAIPVLAISTAYAVAEIFGWRESLSDRTNKAKGFYTVISASIIVGVGIALSGLSPMKALLYSQVLGGMVGPLLVTLILFLCNDRRIMGTLVNRWFDNLFGWITVVVLMLGSAGIFWQFLAS
jgi:Mn2+/Fe2+ NRAMP family transporter